MKTLSRTIIALATSLALAACGGGGSPETTSTNPAGNGATAAAPTADVVSAAGNLQASVPGSTYAIGSGQALALEAMNTLRQAAGAGLLAQSAQLDVAAVAHAHYLTSNVVGLQDVHNEDAAKPGYYARSVGDRIQKAGFVSSIQSEVIVGTAGTKQIEQCIKGALNSVYRGAEILSRNTSVGVGIGSDYYGSPMCVLNFATAAGNTLGQVPAAGKLVSYPHAGQADVAGTFDLSREVVRPSATLLPNQLVGSPILVSVRNADFVNFAAAGTLSPAVTNYVLKDAGGNPIPAVILAHHGLSGAGVTVNTDPQLPEGFVALVPRAPLIAGQTYTVDFSVTLKPGAAALGKSWSFMVAPVAGGGNAPSAGGGASSGIGPGTFAFEKHSGHTKLGSMGDQVIVTVRNVGSSTIHSASLVCGGGSFFGGISGQTLPSGASFSTVCTAASNGSAGVTVKAWGVDASNSDVVFGPF